MTFQVFLPRDAMHKHSMWLCGVCPSVCLSVTFVDFVKANKHIFNFLIVFPYTKRYGNILTPPPPYEGVEYRWGRQKSRFSADIWLHRMLWTVRLPSYKTDATDRGKLMTLVAGKRRRLFFTKDDAKCLWQEAWTLRRRQQSSNDKSAAKLTTTGNQCASPPRGNAIPAGPLSDSGEILCCCGIPIGPHC